MTDDNINKQQSLCTYGIVKISCKVNFNANSNKQIKITLYKVFCRSAVELTSITAL